MLGQKLGGYPNFTLSMIVAQTEFGAIFPKGKFQTKLSASLQTLDFGFSITM